LSKQFAFVKTMMPSFPSITVSHEGDGKIDAVGPKVLHSSNHGKNYSFN
jgi:hypothetical protein